MKISNLTLLTIAFATTSAVAQPAADVLIHDANVHTVTSKVWFGVRVILAREDLNFVPDHQQPLEPVAA